MPEAETFRCLTFHAECLETDAVWNLVKRLLGKLGQRGARATLFVNPLGAIRSGANLGERLSWLTDQGHEVAQHSHYYQAEGHAQEGERRKLPTALTPENIRRCLSRDYDYLAGAGFKPLGFVSGAWAIDETIFQWLSMMEFSYDCSYRTYTLPYENPAAKAGDNCTHVHWRSNLLEVPTTGGIAQMLKARATGNEGLLVNGGAYHLYYLHDSDLVSLAKRGALFLIETVLASGETRVVTVSQLAEHLKPRVPNP